MEGRDAVWHHPDLMPTGDDLDDPDGFVHGRSEFEGVDFDISKLTDPDGSEKPKPGEEPGDGKSGNEDKDGE